MADTFADAAVEIVPDVSGFSARLRAAINSAVRRSIKIHVELDLTRFRAQVERARRELERELRVNITAQLQTGQIGALRERLQAAAERFRINVEVDADVTPFIRRLLALEARLRGFRIRIPVDVDLNVDRPLVAQLFRIQQMARRGGQDSGRSFSDRFRDALSAGLDKIGDLFSAKLIKSVLKVTAIGAALAFLAASATTALGPLASLGQSLIDLSGFAAIIPGAIVGAAAAFGVLAATFGTVKQKIGENLQGPLQELQKTLESRVTKNFDKDLQILAHTILPAVKGSLISVADGWNLVFRSIANVAMSNRFIDAMKLSIGNTGGALKILAGAVKPALQAFGDLAAIGTGFFPAMARSIADAATKFQLFIAHARESGRLQEIIQRGIDVFKQLGQIVLNVGSIIGTVFNVASTVGGGFLNNLVNITTAIRDMLRSAEGSEKLRNFFVSLQRVSAATTPVFIALFKGIADISSAIADVAVALGPVLVRAIKAIVPAINELAPGIVAVIEAIGKAIEVFAPTLTAIGTTIANVFKTLAPAITPVVESIGKIIKALLPIIEEIATVVADVAPIVAEAFAEIAQAIAPVVKDLIHTLAPILPSLARLFVQVAQAAGPIIQALGTGLVGALKPLIPLITQIVDTMGGPMKLLFQSLGPIIKLLSPAFLGLTVVLGGVFIGLLAVVKGLSSVSKALKGDFEGAKQDLADIGTAARTFAADLKQSALDMVSGADSSKEAGAKYKEGARLVEEGAQSTEDAAASAAAAAAKFKETQQPLADAAAASDRAAESLFGAGQKTEEAALKYGPSAATIGAAADQAQRALEDFANSVLSSVGSLFQSAEEFGLASEHFDFSGDTIEGSANQSKDATERMSGGMRVALNDASTSLGAFATSAEGFSSGNIGTFQTWSGTVTGITGALPGQITGSLGGLSGDLFNLFNSAMSNALGAVSGGSNQLVTVVNNIPGRLRANDGAFSEAGAHLGAVFSAALARNISVPSVPTPTGGGGSTGSQSASPLRTI